MNDSNYVSITVTTPATTMTPRTTRTPIRGCDNNPCRKGGTCIDEINGKFKCICKNGWQGKLCEEKDNFGKIFFNFDWFLYNLSFYFFYRMSC